MAGMTNPSFKTCMDDYEKRLTKVEKDIEDLKYNFKDKDKKEENMKNTDVNEVRSSNIINLDSIMNSGKKYEIKRDIPENAYYVGNRNLDMLQSEVNSMMEKFNNSNGLNKAS